MIDNNHNIEFKGFLYEVCKIQFTFHNNNVSIITAKY